MAGAGEEASVVLEKLALGESVVEGTAASLPPARGGTAVTLTTEEPEAIRS